MSHDPGRDPQPSRRRNVTAWILSVVLCAAHLAAAVAQIGGMSMIQITDQNGLGQVFSIVTGFIEIVGALALLTPGYALFGALWLAATMVGPILAQLLICPTPAAPAVVLLILDITVAWLRRDKSAYLLARLP